MQRMLNILIMMAKNSSERSYLNDMQSNKKYLVNMVSDI